MKLVFAILVLLALLTEGKEKSGERPANFKNHALGMRKLVKTAVLHEDEALRKFNGTAMPELPERFQFPVVVDLTEFERMLEQRFNSINGNIDSINGNIKSLRLKMRGSSHCQMGTIGCVNNCGAKEGKGTYSTTYRVYHYFTPTFSKRPDVVLAMNRILQMSEGEDDWYGWMMYPTEVSTNGFYANIEMLDRKMTTFKAIWIACYYL